MDLNTTDQNNGLMIYESYITGPQGAKFILYPEKSGHTQEDIEKAKRWLRANQDVVKIDIDWVEAGSKKEKELYDTLDRQFSCR